jgi:uncharacterized protein (TIGR01777 family)
MQVVVTGATGTIGRALVRELLQGGHGVIALSRDAQRAQTVLGEGVKILAWPDPAGEALPGQALGGADAVVHLLGEPIAQRWTTQAKRRIRDSRVESTRRLVATLHGLPDDVRPRVLVSQSAAGFYGVRGDEWVDESASPGVDWLARLVVNWETAAAEAGDVMRVVTTRTGIAISPTGGALAKMLPFFRLGLGGPVAGGHQYVPWVHLDDVVGALICCLEEAQLSGAANVTSPNPVTNSEFSHALGQALHRPAVLPVPGFALSLLYGEMAQMVTTGQRIRPAQLLALGYRFRQPELDRALADVVGTK